MKKLNKELTLITSQLHGSKGRTLIVVLTVAMFVLGAGAPSATGGI